MVGRIYGEQCYMVVADKTVSWYEAQEIFERRHAYLADMPETVEREAMWRYAEG